MSDISRLRAALQGGDPKRLEFKAVLGRADGTVKATDETVYVTLYNGNVIEVFNERVPLKAYRKVKIGYDDNYPKLLQVLAFDDVYDSHPLPHLPNHKDSHRWFGHDPVEIYTQQIMQLLPRVVSAMTVRVYGGEYFCNGKMCILKTTDIDMTAELPVSGAEWVNAEIDDAGAITFNHGANKDSRELLLPADIPLPAATKKMLYSAKMYVGLTTFIQTRTDNDIYDPRFTGIVGGATSDVYPRVWLEGAPPTIADDYSLGYVDGDIWIDQAGDDAYILLDAGAATCIECLEGTAVWYKINGAAGGGGDASTTTYTPAVPADWDGCLEPDFVDEGLDELAGRVETLENANPPPCTPDASVVTYTPNVPPHWLGCIEPDHVDEALDELCDRVADLEYDIDNIDSADVIYTPAVPGDWTDCLDPGDVDDALDQLAERMTDVEGAGGGGTAADVTVADAGGYFAGANVEAVLQELGLDGRSFTTTATAAGTTTLTAASSHIQVFTGATTETVLLPDTSTLFKSWTVRIINTSTGIITVKTSSSLTVASIAPKTDSVFVCLDTTSNLVAAWYWSRVGEYSIYLSDVVTGNSTIVSHGFAPKAVAPAAGSMNVLGILEGETGFSNKAALTPTQVTDLTDGGETTLHTHAGGGGGDKYPFEARLTLETGVPFSTTPQTAKTTIYLTPYNGNQIATYDGVSAWSTIALSSDVSIKATDTQDGTTTNGNKVITGLTDTSQLVVGMLATGTGLGAAPNAIASIDSGTQVTLSVNSTASATVAITFKLPASTVYDVFAFDDSGTAKLELVAGTSTRTTQDGVDVKTGATTRRLVGTIYTTTTVGQLEISPTFIGVSNLYNQLPTGLFRCPGYSDNAASTTYTTTATSWAEANGASKVFFVLCKPQLVTMQAKVNAAPAAGQYVYGSIGVDTTSNPIDFNVLPSFGTMLMTDNNSGLPLAAGSHYATMLIAVNTGTATVWADWGGARAGASRDGTASFIFGSIKV